jgi:hypothetical protein
LTCQKMQNMHDFVVFDNTYLIITIILLKVTSLLTWQTSHIFDASTKMSWASRYLTLHNYIGTNKKLLNILDITKATHYPESLRSVRQKPNFGLPVFQKSRYLQLVLKCTRFVSEFWLEQEYFSVSYEIFLR